jgi:putative ABC transport system substrate-binding protein
MAQRSWKGHAVGLLSAAVFVLMAPGAVQPQTNKVHRVAIVPFPTSEGQAYVVTFRAAMRDLGYVEGKNLILDVRLVDRDMTGVPGVLDEVIRHKADVLVGWESVAQVMRSKTTSIPIVLAGAVDPIGAGLAHSLRRPGTNVTGVVQLNDLLPAKHIEIMRQIRPRLTRVGQLVDTTASGCKLVEQQSRQAAASFGAVMVPYYVTNRVDIERAFAQMEKEKPDVLLPCPSAVMFNHRDFLFENVLRLGIPLTSFVPANVPTGVLFAYAASPP